MIYIYLYIYLYKEIYYICTHSDENFIYLRENYSQNTWINTKKQLCCIIITKLARNFMLCHIDESQEKRNLESASEQNKH